MTERLHSIATGRGFSLLETLVALCILSAAMGAILSVFSTALTAAAEADAITRAVRAGESLLARVGADIPLAEGASAGTLDDALAWRMTVTAYRPDAELAAWQMPLRAYWVELDVEWGEADQPRSVHLSTLRLSPERRLTL